MPRIVPTAALISALTGLGACVNVPPARETQVIVQPPAQPAVAAFVAPGPPPAPQAELVPPPPQGAGTVVWQPGHWMFTGMAGNPWSWQPGQYVPPPMGQTTWVPGHWAQQYSGGWAWVEGHWA
jgi:hypothetical protein